MNAVESHFAVILGPKVDGLGRVGGTSGVLALHMEIDHIRNLKFCMRNFYVSTVTRTVMVPSYMCRPTDTT